MLIWSEGSTEPRVVCDVDQELRSSQPKGSAKLRVSRFIADQDGEPGPRQRKNRQVFARLHRPVRDPLNGKERARKANDLPERKELRARHQIDFLVAAEDFAAGIEQCSRVVKVRQSAVAVSDVQGSRDYV